MRQRKVKNEAIRLAAVEYLQIKNGQEILGRWRDFLKEKNHDFTGGIFLEIGCGRGHFLASMGEANPNHFYLGAEGRSSVVLKAMELIQEKELANVLFIPEFILDIESYFAEGELTGIYLNFSDPWPKKRHTKRRLTNRKYLAGYRHVLAPGGFIEFKTDSDEFFDFTLEECSEAGLTVEESTRDLHNTDLPARLVTTQYEELFRSLGKPIHYCRIRV
ncbi:MAG TPA: tRNA (guanosine(46)-N7)-methyltransferase TrmB [Bacillota bacterium]|jgi:tRNA (guanine-N7-)-methyltransferase|nr:tRNA (guanosine(46)-N7)-methyltransferase TrmB [Bacillota bacterium]HPZ59689.1 tRNA (guanosine(46)-N7)-methyltransferase TrmB [Bacillota bacterium]